MFSSRSKRSVKKSNPQLTALLFASASAGLGFAHSAWGQNTQYTYTGNTTSNWSTAAWSPGTPTSAATTQLNFNGSGATAYTATNDITAGFSLNEIYLNSTATVTDVVAGSSLAFSPAGSIVQAGTGAFNISNAIALNSDFLTYSSTGTGGVSLLGVVSGSGGIAKTASSSLTLGGANTFTGGVNLSTGTIYLTNAAGLGTGTLTALAAATLDTSGLAVGNTIANAMVLPSTGRFTLNINGAAGNTKFSGNISGGTTSSTLYLNTSAQNTSGVIELSNANSSFVTSAASGSSGGIILNRGTLQVDTANALGNSANSVYLDSYAGESLIFGGSFTYTHPTYSTLATNYNTGTYSDIATGVISGTQTFTKTGTGVLTLNATNTYTGATTVSAGALVGASTAAFPNFGLSAGTISVSAGATLGGRAGGSGDFTSGNLDTLRLKDTFATGSYFGIDTTDGNFSYGDPGVGITTIGLNKLGTNNLTLTTTGTYTGGTQISGGSIIPAVPNALSTGNIYVQVGASLNIASGTSVNSNATFFANVGGSSTNATAGSLGTLNLNSSTGSASNPDVVFGSNHTGNSYDGATISSSINLGSSQRYIWGYSSHNGVGVYGITKTDAVLSGAIGGTGGLTIIGKNDTQNSDMAVQFALTGSNTFTGPVVITGGSLYLGNANALVQGNALSFAPVSGDFARFFLYGNNASVSNLTSSGAGSSVIANGNKTTLASTALPAATLTTNQTANTTYSGTITDAFYEYAGTGTQTQGNLSLVKNGSASLVLNGTVTYTGTTTINAGTLEIDAAASTSAVTVNSTGTLAGSGSIAGGVTLANGGAISAGSSGTGNLTVGSLQLGVNSGDVSTINVSQVGNLIDNGALNISSGATSTINVGGSASGFTPGMSYPLISYNTTNVSLNGSQVPVGLTLGSLPTRVLGSLVGGVNGSTNVISLAVTGVDFPIWTGAASNQWNTSDVDWALNSSNSTSTTYMAGDSVLFSDLAGSAHTNVVINGADVFPGGVTFNTSLNYTLSGTNGINGSTGLVVSGNSTGNGSLTINNTNSFTGNVNISSATVIVPTLTNSGVAGPLGSGSSILLNAGTLSYTGSSVTNNRAITLGASGGTINVNNSGTALTLATGLTGTSTLTVSGAGSLVMSVPNTAFSGPIVVNSGNLSVSADTQLGAVPASVTPSAITLNGTGSLITTANFALSANRGITGTGSLIINSGLSMSGSNTYSGGTQLNGGALSIVNGTELGSGPLTVGTGVSSSFLTVANTAAVAIPNAVVLPASTASQTLVVLKNSSNASAGTQLSLNGNISGGSSFLTLEFNSSASGDYSTSYLLGGNNTFTATLDINRGNIILAGPTSLGNSANKLILDSNSTTTGGILNFAGSFTTPNPVQINSGYSPYPFNTGSNTDVISGTISGTGIFYKNGAGTLILTGNNTFTNTTTIAAGTLQLGNGGTTGSLPATNVSNNATLAFNRSDTVTFGNVISGTGAVTQTGPGTLILSASNTYTGATTVNGGKLQINGSLAAGSAVTVNSGGGLTGTGVVNGPVTLNNNSSIGTTGTFTVGGLNFGALSTDTSAVNLVSAVNGGSPAPSQIIDTGAINVSSGTNTITINISGVPLATNTYQLIDYNSSTPSLASISAFKLGTLPSGVVANLVNDTANSSIDLNVTSGDYPKWTGALNGEWVNGAQSSPHNWQFTYGGTPTDYTDGNAVMFDDSAGNPNVDISSGNVAPNSVTFTNSGATYNITGTNGITGSTGVTMSGNGTVIFSNLNTYTGDTLIAAGTIVANNSSTGSAGPLGTGTVRLGATSSNGNNPSLLLGNVGSGGGISLSNPIIVQSGSGGTLTIGGQNASGINTLTGNITIGTGSTAQTLTVVEATGGELDVNGNISDNGLGGNLVLGNGSNNGTIKLNGSNTYTGTTTVNGGTVIAVNTTVPAVNNGLVINSGTFVSTGTLTLTPTTNGAIVSGDTITSVSGGTIALNSSSASVTSPDIADNLPSHSYYGVTVSSNIVVGPGNHFIVGVSGNNSYGEYSAGDLTLTGALSGSGNLTVYGAPASSQFEVALFNNNSQWTGNLTIARGDVAAVVPGAIQGNNVAFTPAAGQTAALYLFGIDMTIGNLTGTGAGTMLIRNGSNLNGSQYGANCNLTVNQTTDGTFAGVISNGPNDYYAGTASTASLGLIKTGSANLTLNGANTYTGDTDINAGTLTLGSNGSLGVTNVNVNTSLVFATTPHSGIVTRTLPGSLTVNSGATVTFAYGAHADRQVLVPAAFNNNGLIDLGNSDMDLPGNVGLQTITSQIASGYNGGAWNGTTGITSSAAANDPRHLTTLGVIVNDDGTGTSTPLYGIGGGLGTLFSGVLPTDGDILVKSTYYGDANLDGKIDGSDYTRIDNGVLMNLTGWYNGDFNYDGVINGSDYTLIDNAFNTQGASLAAEVATPTAQIAGGTAAVPEPATLGLVGFGAIGLLGRRRRRS